MKRWTTNMIGKSVRVISEMAGKVTFGLQGYIKEYSAMGSEVTIVIPTSHRADIPDRKIIVKRSCVGEMAEDQVPSKKKTLPALKSTEKRKWLDVVDFGNLEVPAGDSFRKLVDELALQTISISGEHILVGWMYLRWAVQISGKAHIINPYLISAWQQCRESRDDPDPNIRFRSSLAVEKQSHLMRLLFDKSLMLLVPINDGGHWTLMVLDQTPRPWTQASQIRYYDTLTQESLGCRRKAEEVRDEIMPDFKGRAMPCRRNQYRQIKGGAGCGFTTLHYMEEEMRHFKGEGWAAAGWPDEAAMKKELHKVMNNIDTEEYNMRVRANQVKEDEERKAMKASVLIEHLNQSQQRNKDRARDELAASNAFADGDESLPDLAIFIGKERKKREEKKDEEKKDTRKDKDTSKGEEKKNKNNEAKKDEEKKEKDEEKKDEEKKDEKKKDEDKDKDEEKKAEEKKEEEKKKQDEDKDKDEEKKAEEKKEEEKKKQDEDKDKTWDNTEMMIQALRDAKSNRTMFNAWADTILDASASEWLTDDELTTGRRIREEDTRVCSTCRWATGCHHCDAAKYVRWLLSIKYKIAGLPQHKAWARQPRQSGGGQEMSDDDVCMTTTGGTGGAIGGMHTEPIDADRKIYIYIYIYIYTHVCMYVYMYVGSIHVCMYTCMYTCM
jgi:hypothetical protein